MDAWEELEAISTAPPGSDAWEMFNQVRTGNIISEGILVTITDGVQVEVNDAPIAVTVEDTSIHVEVEEIE